MSMQTDVKSTYVAAGTTAAIFAGPARIKGMTVSYPIAGGSLTLKDGSGGTTVYYFNAPAAAGSINILIPGEGIRCDNGIYATTVGATATVFYG